EETIYFPKDGSEVDFLAYSPYRKNFKATEKLPLTLAVQTSQSELDFMTAEHLEGTTKETPNVKLRFYHRLTKLIFNLKTETGDDAVRLIGSKITVTGMPLSGDFHPENKTVMADAATVGDNCR
ncbi:MAG: fimbrillin family protein, partial [Odoribacter sp.]